MATLGDLGRDPVASHCRHRLTQTPCMALGGPFRAWTSWEPPGCHEPVRCRSEMTGGLRAYVGACVCACLQRSLKLSKYLHLHRCTDATNHHCTYSYGVRYGTSRSPSTTPTHNLQHHTVHTLLPSSSAPSTRSAVAKAVATEALTARHFFSSARFGADF